MQHAGGDPRDAVVIDHVAAGLLIDFLHDIQGHLVVAVDQRQDFELQRDRLVLDAGLRHEAGIGAGAGAVKAASDIHGNGDFFT